MLALARALFRLLPLNEDQRSHLRKLAFRFGGERFRHLPSYQLYQQQQQWDRAMIPGDIAAIREQTLAEHFTTRHPRAMLMISHALGGGTATHLRDLMRRLQADGWGVYLLERHNRDHLRLIDPSASSARPLFFRWPDDIPALTKTLRLLDIAHLHLHHTVDMPEDFLPRFQALAAGMGLAYDFTAHDYFSICPRFTLYDDAVRSYCGEPEDARKCIACVSRFGSPAGKDVDVPTWRSNYAALLAGARKVFVPDVDVAIRLKRYFPEVTITAQPHPETPAFIDYSAQSFQNTSQPSKREARSGGGSEAMGASPPQTRKIVTIGGIAPHKGSHVLEACARDALARNLPLEFHIIGFTDIDHRLSRLSNVKISGRFDPEELPARLKAGGYHLAFLPAVWPETFNYTLTECWQHGLYTVGLDIGAIASRIKAAPTLGKILPLEWYLKPEKLNDALLAVDIPKLEETEVRAQAKEYPKFTPDYYGL